MCESATVFGIGVVLSVLGVLGIWFEVYRMGSATLKPPDPQWADESRRYRDYEWHMTVWAVSLSAALIAVSLNDKKPAP